MNKKESIQDQYAELVVNYSDKKIVVLNKSLMDSQNCWENLEAIKEAHWLKLIIYELMEETNNKKSLKSLGLDLREIEYHLQSLWKFPLNGNYHRFWECPKCKCPIMDNNDWYPYRSVVSPSCPIHGESWYYS